VCGEPCGDVVGGKELEILDITLDDTALANADLVGA
jgi:hypothetical protein